jgi:hypothetical protein
MVPFGEKKTKRRGVAAAARRGLDQRTGNATAGTVIPID